MDESDTKRIETFHRLTSRNPIRNEAMGTFAPSALVVWNKERYTSASVTDMRPLTAFLYQGGPIHRWVRSVELMTDVDPDVTAYAIAGENEHSVPFAECIAFSKASDDKVVWFAHKEDGSTFGTGDLKSALTYRSALEAQQAAVGVRYATSAPAQAPGTASESEAALGIPTDLEVFIWRLYADMHPGTMIGSHQRGHDAWQSPEWQSETTPGAGPRYDVRGSDSTAHGEAAPQARALPRPSGVDRYFLLKEQALWDGKPVDRVPDAAPALEGFMFRQRPDPDNVPIRILPGNSSATVGGGPENLKEGDSLTVEFVPALFADALDTFARRPFIDTLKLVRGGAMGYLVVSHDRQPYTT